MNPPVKDALTRGLSALELRHACEQGWISPEQLERVRAAAREATG